MIEGLEARREEVSGDEEHFAEIYRIDGRLRAALQPYSTLKQAYSENKTEEIYQEAESVGNLIGLYYMLAWELSRMDDKYADLVSPLEASVGKVRDAVEKLQKVHDRYLPFEYGEEIRLERERLEQVGVGAVRGAYVRALEAGGIRLEGNSLKKGYQCTPYLYLQAMYLYRGAPNVHGEALLAIDEVQSFAPEELRLLKNINKGVVFNLYGDIHQHIEGTKGVDRWEEYDPVLKPDYYEMQENYRNASQITEYCNRVFEMKMVAINTPGKGVHEINSERTFHDTMLLQLMSGNRAGLSAVLVSNAAEAKALLSEFSKYAEKFHDMTGDDFTLHRTRWNIITINDAKGLEFSTVFVLGGRMTKNQRYIACTRALDELFVYNEELKIEDKPKDETHRGSDTGGNQGGGSEVRPDDPPEARKIGGEVREFFSQKGFRLIDKRASGRPLFVIGDPTELQSAVEEAVRKFQISGKYVKVKELGDQVAWYTKTMK